MHKFKCKFTYKTNESWMRRKYHKKAENILAFLLLLILII